MEIKSIIAGIIFMVAVGTLIYALAYITSTENMPLVYKPIIILGFTLLLVKIVYSNNSK